jgi:hypothetical protein
MKKLISCVCLLLIYNFCLIEVGYADEVSDLKEQIKILQKQMKKQSKLIKQMSARIEKLESKEGFKQEVEYQVKKEVIEILDKQGYVTVGEDGAYKGGLSSIKEKKFEIGGELELEYVNTENDVSTEEPNPHFQLDKLVLKPKVSFNEDIQLKAEIDIDQSSAEVTNCYIQFSEIPFLNYIKVGLEDRFISMNRKTESYPLAGNSFWRDEELGIFMYKEYKPFYAHFSVSQGLEIDSKQVGEDSSYKMFHDNTRTSNYVGIKEAGLGLGVKKELGKLGALDILLFGYTGKLSNEDIGELKSLLSDYSSNNDNQYKSGLNFNYKIQNFNLSAQYIQARDGSLDRDVWYIQPSYKIELPFNFKYLKDYECLVRYGKYNIDTQRSFSKPATWDREELTFGVIAEVKKDVKLKTEYCINDEKTGSSKVNNDEFLMQLEVKF